MGVVRVMYLLRMAKITSGSSFEPTNPMEQKLGYYVPVEAENGTSGELASYPGPHAERVWAWEQG